MTGTNISDFEIMAPVGSRDSLAAAIKAGAGSVYFGIEKLNMRAHSASTFTIGDFARDCGHVCLARYKDISHRQYHHLRRGSLSDARDNRRSPRSWHIGRDSQ